MIDTLILPAFGKIPLRDISAADVIAWQNDLMKHRDENGNRIASEQQVKELRHKADLAEQEQKLAIQAKHCFTVEIDGGINQCAG